MAAIFGVLGAAVSAAGTIAGGAAAQDASVRQAQAHEFKALQYEQQADESRASSQRVALEKRQEGRLLQSTLQARAAASGGGATDPTVVALGSEIAGASEYNALTERYKGENRALGFEDEATASRLTADAVLAEGEAKKKAAMFSGIGTLIGGFGSAFRMNSGAPSISTTVGYG